MKLDKKTYAMIMAILSVLASWGAREKSWSKRFEESTHQIESINAEKKTLIDQKTALETQNKSDAETTEEVVPVQMPNGSVAYITRKTSRTVQEAISKATTESQTQIAELTKQLKDITTFKKTEEKQTIKPAALWNIVAEADVLTGASWSAGAGINVGPVSISVLNPVALTFNPRAVLALRF